MDDSEVALLRVLLDELFGRDRFVACNVWQKRYSRENREAIGDVHEYLLVYAMDPGLFKTVRNRVPPTERQAKIYRNPNNDPKGRWRPIPMTAQAGHATSEQFYEIVAPSGKVFRPTEGRCWALSKATFERLRQEGRIYFGKKGNSQPNVIHYLSEVEGMVPWTWWPHEDVGHTDEASKELLALFGGATSFDTTPKPTRLIERILNIATNPGDLILDSFAGSGTTGHAVLGVNRKDAGGRRFLLVEMERSIAKDITAERIRRVAEGYTNGKGDQVEGLGGGFRYCVLGDQLFDETGNIAKSVRFSDLASHVFFTETGVPMPKQAVGKSPLLGTHDGKAVYLLFNGVLGDKRPDGGNVLTGGVLRSLCPHPEGEGLRVVYGEGCRLSPQRLKREGIVFKQVPYQIKVS